MNANKTFWNGKAWSTQIMPHDPNEDASPCPICGELPQMRRNQKSGYRWILGCQDCDLEAAPARWEESAVSEWNETVSWYKEDQKNKEWEAEQAARIAEENAWADERDRKLDMLKAA